MPRSPGVEHGIPVRVDPEESDDPQSPAETWKLVVEICSLQTANMIALLPEEMFCWGNYSSRVLSRAVRC